MSLKKLGDLIFQNPYIMAILKVTVILYASQLAPRLNTYDIFNNIFVKIFAIFFIIYSAERKDYQMAIIVAVLYVISLNVASGRGLFEPFANFSNEIDSATAAKLIEPKSNIYPGCQDITLDKLVQAFDGDRNRLTQMVVSAYGELLEKMEDSETKEKVLRMARAMGLPYKYELKEEHAPYIATLLVYFGFVVSDSCSPPK